MNIFPNISRVLLLDNVASQAADKLQNAGVEVRIKNGSHSENQLIELIREFTPSAIIVRSATKITKSVIEAGVFCVRIIARAGVGVDNIDVEAARCHGILVINAPIGNTLSAIEHTCALILTIARQLHVNQLRLHLSKEDPWKEAKNLANSRVNGITEVSGKTLGIIGLGRIGSGVGKRMHAFGMNVIGYDPQFSSEKGEANDMWLSSLCKIEDIWKLSDYITLHVPLSPSTRHIINGEVLDKCKYGVRLINCSRGGVIDEEALLLCLESGKCGGAAIDVFENEPPKCDSRAAMLLQNQNVIVTPHTGGSSEESQIRVAIEVVDAILAIGGFSNNQKITGLENAVNLNKTGLEMKTILIDVLHFEEYLHQYKILCDLSTVAGLFTLHTFNEEYENIEIKSFCASYYLAESESDLVEYTSNTIARFLLQDILFKEEHIFPDTLKALVRETKYKFHDYFKFQKIEELDSDINENIFFLINNLQLLAYLRINCKGSENQKLSLGFGLMEDKSKVTSVYLCERYDKILNIPENIGDTDFLGSMDIQLY